MSILKQYYGGYFYLLSIKSNKCSKLHIREKMSYGYTYFTLIRRIYQIKYLKLSLITVFSKIFITTFP